MDGLKSATRTSVTSSSLLRSAALLALLAMPGIGLADTIVLKDGKTIADCRVMRETSKLVYVRTKMGDMGVPRSEIRRIIKQKTDFDAFSEKRAKIRKGDTSGLYQLAQWARNKGLRSESNRILKKILAQNPKHAGARKRLGHIYLDGKWIVPKPLALRLRSSGKTKVDRNLRIFFQSRPGLRLATEADTDLAPLDVCALNVSVSIIQGPPLRFYGHQYGRGSTKATVTFAAKSQWIGSLTKRVAGTVSKTAGKQAEEQAINSAFASDSRGLHAYFDQVEQKRLLLLEKKLRREARAERNGQRP